MKEMEAQWKRYHKQKKILANCRVPPFKKLESREKTTFVEWDEILSKDRKIVVPLNDYLNCYELFPLVDILEYRKFLMLEKFSQTSKNFDIPEEIVHKHFVSHPILQAPFKSSKNLSLTVISRFYQQILNFHLS